LIQLVERGEAEVMMREDIVALLSRNPHCLIANMLGRALIDLFND